jgi:hypothetical protein
MNGFSLQAGMLKVASAPPASYPDPIMWIDASYVASMFDQESGGSNTANNGQVHRIEDRSGNGNHMLTEAPAIGLRRDAIQNGLAALDMTGTTEGYETATGLVITRPYTIMLVAKQTVTDGSTRIVNSLTKNCLLSVSRVSNCVYGDTGDIRGNALVAGANIATIATLRVSASATTTVYANGTTDLADGSPPSVDWGEITMGYPGLFNEGARAYLFELLVWNTHLSDVDWQAAQTDKAAKWGITI